MKRMNKKGYIFEIFLLVFTFLTLVFLIVAVYNNPFKGKQDEFNQRGLGAAALRLMQTYQSAEQALLYVDTAAIISAHKAAITTGKVGGLAQGSSCGKQAAYALWNSPNNDSCLPQFTSTFLQIFDKEFDGMTSQFTHPNLPQLTFPDYEYVLMDNNLIGTAADRRIIWSDIVYSFTPSFNVNIGIDFTETEQIIQDMHPLLVACSGPTCIDDVINKYPGWQRRLECDFSKSIACFHVKSNAKFVQGDMIYKFALYFDFPAVEIEKEIAHPDGLHTVLEFSPSFKTDVRGYKVGEIEADITIETEQPLDIESFEEGKLYTSGNKLYMIVPIAPSYELHAVNRDNRLSDNISTPHIININNNNNAVTYTS